MSKDLTIISFSPMIFLFKDVIRKLQDNLDRNPPAIFDVPERSSADDSSNEEEDDIPTCENITTAYPRMNSSCLKGTRRINIAQSLTGPSLASSLERNKMERHGK